MKLSKKLFGTLAALIITFSGSAQEDTISVMYYNLLKFPNINSSRITYLETVVQYMKPDIFVVCELTSGTGATSILNNALNTGSVNYYAAANYVDGPDTENMLYYNTNKLGFIEQNEISTSLRDINEYVLYYKDPGLTAASDTAYLYVYGAHLKAGNNQSDEVERAGITATLKSYLVTRDNPENTIVGGDMNIYYSTEQAYVNLTATNQANLYDPIGTGSYHNNPSYAIHFTQSTRTTSFDGGATGGMDDRFDMMMFSDDVVNGANGVRFIPSSYRAVGQDGLRWNSSLISPVNNSEPANIINALYYMSDHLPIYMELEVGGDLSLEEKHEQEVNVYPNPASSLVKVNSNYQIEFVSIVDGLGKEVVSIHGMNSSTLTLNTADLSPGVYHVLVESENAVSIEMLIIE